MQDMAFTTADRKAEFNGNGQRKRKPRISGDGICLAAKRAMSAARVYLAGTFDTPPVVAATHSRVGPVS
jgi:hypothetical protein